MNNLQINSKGPGSFGAFGGSENSGNVVNMAVKTDENIKPENELSSSGFGAPNTSAPL